MNKMMHLTGKGLLGLKWARIGQWREVLKEEGRSMGPKAWWHLLCEAGNALLYPVGRDKYIHRLTICHRCPIYDKGLKRCRPYTGSNLGCGCFVPYKAVSPSPCYARQLDPSLGWD